MDFSLNLNKLSTCTSSSSILGKFKIYENLLDIEQHLFNNDTYL